MTINKELITTKSNQENFVFISEEYLYPFPIINNIFDLLFYTVKKETFLYVRLLTYELFKKSELAICKNKFIFVLLM